MMKRVASLVAVLVVLAGAAWGEAITGRSGAFLVDTRCREFVIEDVKSAFCHGAYGMIGGQKATFLSGVEANVEFEVTGRTEEVEIQRVEVQGRMHEGRKFTLDVGSLGVGEIVQVVAYGEVNGAEVASLPFRVNCDVASVPAGVYSVWVVSRHDGAIWYMSDVPSTLSILDGIEEGFGLLGEEIPFKFKPSFQLIETMDSRSGMWKEGTGGGIQFDLAPEGKTLAKLVKTQTIGTINSVDLPLEIEGEAIRIWNPERLAWERHSCSLGIHVGLKAKKVIPIPETLGLVRFHGGIKTDVKANIGLDADGELFGTLDWNPVFGLYGGVKAGFPGVWADGTGGGGISMKAGFPQLSGRYIQELKGALWVDFKWRVIILGLGNYNDPDSLHLEWPYNFIGGAENAERVTKAIPAMQEPCWKLLPRDYLAAGAQERKGATKTAFRAANWTTGGYPYPAPAVAAAGGFTGVAYLRDDGTRADADRTEVVFGEYAESVWNDGTADFEPSLGMSEDGAVVLAWANAKSQLPSEPDLETVCRAMELAVAVRNPATGTWAAQNLTDDEALDARPVVCVAGDGTAMVAWLRNEGGAYFGSTESPAVVMASRWDGSAWGAPVTVAEGVGAVSGLDLAYDGTNGCVVWAFDGDGDWGTVGDAGVSAAVWSGGAWGAAAVMAEGVAGASPVLARVGGEGATALWGVGGALMERAVDGAGEARATPVAWGGEIPETARAVHGEGGALGLAWEDVEVPVIMRYDEGLGLWGGPLAVGTLEEGRMARGVTAAVGADGVLAAWESVAVATNAAGEVEFGGTELRVAFVEAGAANPGIAADGFSFSSEEVVDGELTGVNVTVRNTGTSGATGVVLRVWACDGELEEDEEARQELWGEDGEPVVLDLPGGAEVTATVSWMAEDFRTNLTFVARVEVPEGVGDADARDNEAVWRPGVAVLRLEGGRCEAVGASTRLLTATVRNAGLAAAAGTEVSFRLGAPDGEDVGRDVAGAVRAGEGHGYDAGVAWEMVGGESWTGAWVTVYAVIATGDTVEEASGAVPIRVMTPRDTDGDGLLDGEEEAMGTDLRKPDTNGDGVSDWEHVYVWFTDPLAGMGGRWTTNTPVRVPFEWLERYPEALEAHGGDYEAFAADRAANGRPVWECYVADLDPTDAGSELRVGLERDEAGAWVPVIAAGESAERRYVFEGAEGMPVGDGEEGPGWGEVGEGSRFFRARVEGGWEGE